MVCLEKIGGVGVGLGLAFAGRRGVDGKRVDAVGKLTRKCRIDHAVALEPAHSAERISHDIDPVMRLPARTMPGMARVLMGLVDHVQAFGRESLGQLLRDQIEGSHVLPL